MRLILFPCMLVLIGLCNSLIAADPPLPPDAQRILDDLDKAVAKLKEKSATDLQKVVEKETKAGHLEPALAVKAKIAALNGQVPTSDTPGSRPATPEAVVQAIQEGTMTEDDWKAIKGTEIVCKASEWTDLKVTISAGQRALIVPCPTDKWQSSPGSTKATYLGENFKQGEWNRESMIVRVNESADTTKRVADNPIVTDAGRLYINAHDTGSPNRIGSIRVKVIVLPR